MYWYFKTESVLTPVIKQNVLKSLFYIRQRKLLLFLAWCLPMSGEQEKEANIR